MMTAIPGRMQPVSLCGGQIQAVQRGYELLGRYLGLFKNKIKVDSDEKLIAALQRGRLRAAGLLSATEEEEEDGAGDGPKNGMIRNRTNPTCSSLIFNLGHLHEFLHAHSH